MDITEGTIKQREPSMAPLGFMIREAAWWANQPDRPRTIYIYLGPQGYYLAEAAVTTGGHQEVGVVTPDPFFRTRARSEWWEWDVPPAHRQW